MTDSQRLVRRNRVDERNALGITAAIAFQLLLIVVGLRRRPSRIRRKG